MMISSGKAGKVRREEKFPWAVCSKGVVALETNWNRMVNLNAGFVQVRKQTDRTDMEFSGQFLEVYREFCNCGYIIKTEEILLATF